MEQVPRRKQKHRYKPCKFTSSGEHEWDDIAESNTYDGWYKWCPLCGALKSPKDGGVVYLPLRLVKQD